MHMNAHTSQKVVLNCIPEYKASSTGTDAIFLSEIPYPSVYNTCNPKFKLNYIPWDAKTNKIKLK